MRHRRRWDKVRSNRERSALSKVRMKRILTDEEMQEEIRDAISVAMA